MIEECDPFLVRTNEDQDHQHHAAYEATHHLTGEFVFLNVRLHGLGGSFLKERHIKTESSRE